MEGPPWCYLDKNEALDDHLCYERIPATWWTLNHRYNYDHEVHRLNVKDRVATKRALCKNDTESKRFRFLISYVTRLMLLLRCMLFVLS